MPVVLQAAEVKRLNRYQFVRPTRPTPRLQLELHNALSKVDGFIYPAANVFPFNYGPRNFFLALLRTSRRFSILISHFSRDVPLQTTHRFALLDHPPRHPQVQAQQMLNRQDRFFSPSGAIYPGGPSIWHVVDWDQRRLVSVKMDEEQESEDVAFEHLLKHIDTLAPDVYLVYLSPDGDILSTSFFLSRGR